MQLHLFSYILNLFRRNNLLLSLISLPTFKQISSSVSSARTINLKLTGAGVIVCDGVDVSAGVSVACGVEVITS